MQYGDRNIGGGRPRMLAALLAVLLPLGAGAAPADMPPLPLRGLTIDSVAHLPQVTAAIRAHSFRPVLRIVFDPETEPSDYAAAIEALAPHADLVGQIADSTAVAQTSIAEMAARTRAFAAAFGDRIAIWEVGNELNGAWLGHDPAEINAKALAAHQIITDEFGGRTLITLNAWFSPDCLSQPWEDTVDFATAMPETLRHETDFLMLSIYETACDPPQHPSLDDVAGLLDRLGAIFPSAHLGIGEISAQRASDGVADPDLAEKTRIARHYHTMHAGLRERLGARFVGGYFWWYYTQDAVPADRAHTLWPTLDGLLSHL